MRHLSAIRAFVVPVVLAIGIALAVRATVVRLYAIPSGSMTPTLVPGDVIAVTPLSRVWSSHPLERGEVVVFRSPSGQLLVKRIVAAPGDHVEIVRGKLRVNGHTVAEPYLAGFDPAETRRPEIVPSEAYYVLGDHRTDSVDSRSWGFVDRAAIVGRAQFVVWSAGSSFLRREAEAVTVSSDETPHRAGIRFDRIMRAVR